MIDHIPEEDMIEYDLYFRAERNKKGDAVLVPVIIGDDGDSRLIVSEAAYVSTLDTALAMTQGVTLAQHIERSGGLHATVLDVMAERVDKEADKQNAEEAEEESVQEKAEDTPRGEFFEQV